MLRGKAFSLRWKESRRWENPRQNAELRWNAVRWNRTWCCPEDPLCSRCFPIALSMSTATIYQTNWGPQQNTPELSSFLPRAVSFYAFQCGSTHLHVFPLMCVLTVIILYTPTVNHVGCNCAIQINYACRQWECSRPRPPGGRRTVDFFFCFVCVRLNSQLCRN